MQDIGYYLKHVEVLIADPDLHIRGLVREVLFAAGFTRIALVGNGEQAISHLRQHNVDLLITDWRMSPVSGIELVHFLRNDSKSPNPYLPVIMLTGKAEVRDVATARDTGITEFLVKPFTAKTLYERLVLVIENPRSFILANQYRGPDRRRRTDLPPAGANERRIMPPTGE